MAWTDPRTWTAGEVVTAALMNTHVRDNLKALGDAWAAYTPTWSSTGTAPALGNGSISGAYLKTGKLVMFRIILQTGSTTTYGTGAYLWSLPPSSTPFTLNLAIGHGTFFDISPTGIRMHAMYIQSSTNVACQNDAGSSVSATVPFTFANGDVMRLQGIYETT